MKKLALKVVLALIGLYSTYFLISFVWFAPDRVQSRVDQKIEVGQRYEEVASKIAIGKPFKIEAQHPCGNQISGTWSIATHYAGGVSVVLFGIVTTTTFCFDSDNNLVGYVTKRWIDAP